MTMKREMGTYMEFYVRVVSMNRISFEINTTKRELCVCLREDKKLVRWKNGLSQVVQIYKIGRVGK